MKGFEKIIFVLLVALMGSNVIYAQSIFVDTTKTLYVNPKTPVHIYLSTSPDGKDAVQLKSQQLGDEPLYWSGHGPHQLTHLDLYVGRNIKFDVFADGLPPKTAIDFDINEGFTKGNTVYLSGSTTLNFSALDQHSGVQEIFVSINGDPYQPYVKPLHFNSEGEHTVKFYSIDNVGNKEDEGERIIHIDSTPPITKLEILGPEHNSIVAASTKLLLNADDLNGIKATFYSIDSAEAQQYRSGITLTQLTEGEHTVTYFSIDKVGNKEQEQIYAFYIDKTPPMVFEELAGNRYMVAGREFTSGRSQLRIVAVDNKAGVQEIHYSINNKPFELYEKPVYLSDISGAVTVRSYAIDHVGNKGYSDTQGTSFSMPKVDITGPTIRFNLHGPRQNLRDTIWISPKTTIAINAKDDDSGLNRVEYKINTSLPIGYEEAFTIDESGLYDIYATAWDNVENLNINNLQVYVDANPPTLWCIPSSKPHASIMEDEVEVLVYEKGLIIYLAASDNEVGIDQITYSLNNSKPRQYTQPISGFKTGHTYTLNCKATDRLGNLTEKSLLFRVE